MTLTPAYGRDYPSAKTVIQDYLAGSDFILNDITSRYDGKPCSCHDFPNQQVTLRYRKLHRATTAVYVPPEPVSIPVPEKLWEMMWSPRPHK